MPLSEQDREWVKAMIQEASTAVLAEVKGYCHEVTNTHSRRCPNIARIKMLLIGIGIGAGAGGIGIGLGWNKLIALLF